MNTPLRRRQMLGMGLAGLGTALLSPGLFSEDRRSASQAKPVKAALIRSTNGTTTVDLVAQSTAGTIPGGPAQLFTYNGRSPGPVIEVHAGDQVQLRLSNRLNQPTNLHFHGLHIPPTGSADNVFVRVPPGESNTYSFQLSANHPAGLFMCIPTNTALRLTRSLGASEAPWWCGAS